MAQNLANMRVAYVKGLLLEETIPKDPMALFHSWFEDHKLLVKSSATYVEPNAMTLATCNTSMRPSARIVLLKEYNNKGFVFHSNYTSRKGAELAANPFAAMTFYWDERQVRLEGKVEKVCHDDIHLLMNECGNFASTQWS